MKVILSFVASADGRVTGPRGQQPRVWASREDQDFFAALVKKTGVVILGRHTYLDHKKFFKKSPHIRRIVMTSDKKLLSASIPGLEFTNVSPVKLIRRLQGEKVRVALLAGGPHLSSAFFKAGLISEFVLTIEPTLFGGGLPILEGPLSLRLSLVSVRKLNATGTVLLRYKVRV